MINNVLLPAEMREKFSAVQKLQLEPLYYHLHPDRMVNRVLRKLGWQSTDSLLKSRFDIPDQRDILDQTEAVWLSDRFTLPNYLLEALLDKMPSLRWVYWQRSGTDSLELDYFLRRNIALSNSGDLVSRAVAEMNIACILAHAKRLPEHHALQNRHKWQAIPCDELPTQTVGIIGSGNIGRETARLCRALGMRTLVASRNPSQLENMTQLFHHAYDLHRELDRLLAESDYVVVAIPLNDTTRKLFGKAQFHSMRNTAALINTARSEIMDQTELFHALNNGQIGAAFIDPPFNRPIFLWSRIYRTKNLHLTHNSAANFRHKADQALGRFIQGIKQEGNTGDFPDRVV